MQNDEEAFRVGEVLSHSLTQMHHDLVKILYHKAHKTLIKLIIKSMRQKLVNSVILECRFPQVPKICLQNTLKVLNEFFQRLSVREREYTLFPVYIPSKIFTTEEQVIACFVRSLGLEELKESPEMHLNEIERKVRKSRRFVVLVMEDIDEYLEYGRQNFIYKVLNIFQTSNLPFVFLATTTVPDVVDLFEKRVKSRFSSFQLLMSEDEPEGKSFDLGYNLWRTTVIEMPENSLDDYKYKQKAIEILEGTTVVERMRLIAKVHASFYRLYSIIKETMGFFMASMYDVKLSDVEISLCDYLESYFENILLYQTEVHKQRNYENVLNCLTHTELLILLMIIRDTQERPRQFQTLYKAYEQITKDDKVLFATQLDSTAYKVSLLHLTILGLVKTVKGFGPTYKSDTMGVQRKWFQKAYFVSRVTKEDFSEEFQKEQFQTIHGRIFKIIK